MSSSPTNGGYRLSSELERLIGFSSVGLVGGTFGATLLFGSLRAACFAALVMAVVTAASLAAAHLIGRRMTREIEEAGKLLSGLTVDGATTSSSSQSERGDLIVRCEELRQHFRELLDRQREARRRAEAADAYQTEFLTAVSHELRNPLNSILGFTDVLLSEIDGPLSEGQREDLGIIRSAGDHLISLFNDILDLSAAATGRLKLAPELVSLMPLLRRAAQELEGQVAGRPIEVRVEAPAEVPMVSIDPKRLRQLLGNLTSNALKFTRQGTITLGLEVEDTFVRISVSDTGDGISREEMAAIFAEFGQGEIETRRGRGSGLGLAISRQIAELSGGTLAATSVEGDGATFTVTLPIQGNA